MKRKILLATPIKTGVDGSYMAGFIPTLLHQFPDIEIEHAILGGPSVNFARNDLVHYARAQGCGELTFIDADMGWNLDYYTRLISHTGIAVVAGLYCKRKPGDPFWLLNLKPGCEIDQGTGLLEVNDIATGFMKIDLDMVCPALEKKYPHLEYFNKPEKGITQTSWEFFPMGCVGPRTPAARLDRIRAILDEPYPLPDEIYGQRARLIEACYVAQPPSDLRGEDYMFCHMVRECGFKVYADFGLPIIPHIGDIPFPITPEMVGFDPEKGLLVRKAKS